MNLFRPNYFTIQKKSFLFASVNFVQLQFHFFRKFLHGIEGYSLRPMFMHDPFGGNGRYFMGFSFPFFFWQDAWIVSTPFSFNCEQSLLNALILSVKRNKLCSRALDFIWGCARPKNVIIYSWIEVLHFVYTISLSRQTSARWCLRVLPSHKNSANREIWYLLAFTFSHMISNCCKVMSSPHPFFPLTINLRSYFNATTTYLYLMCVCNKWRWKY